MKVRRTKFSVLTIEAALNIARTVSLNNGNLFPGEPGDPNDYLPDPYANTEEEAVTNIYHAGLKRALEEAMNS